MSDLDVLALLQQLYLVSTEVEATAASWLHEAGEGRRSAESDELQSMRELQVTAARQRDNLAQSIMSTLGKSAQAATGSAS